MQLTTATAAVSDRRWARVRADARRIGHAAGTLVRIRQAECVRGRDLTASPTFRAAVQVVATLAALSTCVATGLAWALAAVVTGVALDGTPPGYHYDAGNRAAIFVFLMLLSVVCPVACVSGFVLGRWLDRSRSVSVLIGQVAAIVPAGLVFVMLADVP
jgi:hypothetical protein